MRHILTDDHKKHLAEIGISPALDHVDCNEYEYGEHYEAWRRTLGSATRDVLHQKTLASIAHQQQMNRPPAEPPAPPAPAPAPEPTKAVAAVIPAAMESAPSYRNELRTIAILLLLVFFALVRPAHCQFSHISTIQFQHSDNSNAGFYASPFIAKEGTNITFTQGTCPGTDCGKVIFSASSTAATAFSGITAATNSNPGTFAASGNTWDFTAATTFKLASGTHFSIGDASDTTKKLQLDLSNITTATTRTLFIPDANNYTIKAGASTGQIPIWNNATSTYDVSDPLVQGTQAAASTTIPNPVVIGGSDYGGTAAVRVFKVDASGNGFVTFSNSTIAVTGTFWQATQPVSIATMPTTPVTGTFWQATQPVSGTVTTSPPSNASTNIAQIGGTTVTPDPCSVAAKTPLNISLTANTQLVAGVSAKKIYVCSISLLAAAATNVAIVEGTGSTCGTSTAGVLGGSTAATGYNFAANGGIAMGNGGASVTQTATAADALCLLVSAANQVSGHIMYVQQ